jgi:tetratricopeptide (TPR) repeat protein
MPSQSAKPIVFISYAHPDEPEQPRGDQIQWYSLVRKFLRAGERRGLFEVWVDAEMMGGDDWDRRIKEKLGSCSIFVLLVSADSMASSYILDTEIDIIRRRLAVSEPVQFYPLLISPTPLAGLDDIRDKNIRPKNLKPLSGYDDHGRCEHLVEFANEIQTLAQKAAGTSNPRRLGNGRSIFTSPKLVHISRLPETGYKNLVGRGVELALLDAELEDPGINILSLVAEGGAGKSALVNEWLRRLQTENYRGAESVLGWSFFSQGSDERATAADDFLNWALAKLEVKVESTSASAKGEAIADALTKRRVLLFLDGVEPLQHGPGPQEGQLKDQGLRSLLRRFAAEPPRADHGLIVVTSRAAVADIQSFESRSAPVVSIERLSDEAGAELLRDNDVRGTDHELRTASHDFGGHPLALTLLASYLRETQNGDVRRRDRIRGLLADADNPRHDQARRVMESYEKEWLADQPIPLAVLHCVGLFDRPASGDCLKALRAKPVIPGLTDALVDLSDEQWRRNVERLREVRLLAPRDPSDPEALDAHPLVREWFGERLKATNETAWKAAHSRLYDHLRDTTYEGQTPTLTDLAPLYHAIAHGCRAGMQQAACENVYRDRIQRRDEFYSWRKLGTFGADLSAIACFFEPPWRRVSPNLTPPNQAWLLSGAGFDLQAVGRLTEALEPMRVGLDSYVRQENWIQAANVASNLSALDLTLGKVDDAIRDGETAVDLADRSGDVVWRSASRATRADVLHQAGRRAEAEALFVEAEAIRAEAQPESRLLSSWAGFWYCDFRLADIESAAWQRLIVPDRDRLAVSGPLVEARSAVKDRAAQTVEIAEKKNLLVDIGLDKLTLARAALYKAILRGVSPTGEFMKEAVDYLRRGGQQQHVPRGLLTHSLLRAMTRDFDGAREDLDKAFEIAEPASMQLHLADIDLHRVRLFGLMATQPEKYPWGSPRDDLDRARKLIEECGYSRRRKELEDAEAAWHRLCAIRTNPTS